MINISVLEDEYFAFDKPVKYKLRAGKTIEIKPYLITEKKQFRLIQTLFQEDKRDRKETEEKTDLQFFIEDILKSNNEYVIFNALLSRMNYKMPFIGKIDDHYIIGTYIKEEDKESKEIKIKLDESSIILEDEWEDIVRIIMYQNDPDYDDEVYFDATIRKNIAIENSIKNKGTTPPSLERQFYIIYAHSGIPREDLIKLTLRGFTILFNEVIGEAEFIASYALRSKYAEKGKPAEHWIWQKKKKGLDAYASEAKGFLSGLGMDGNDILKEAYEEKEVAFKNEVSQDDIEEIRRKIAAGEM